MANLYKLEREPEILSAYYELREKEAEDARRAAEATAIAEAAAAEAAAAAAEAAEADSPEERLRALRALHEEGLITDEEYQTRKRERSLRRSCPKGTSCRA